MNEEMTFYRDKLKDLVETSRDLDPLNLLKMHFWIGLGIRQKIITPEKIGFFATQTDSKSYDKYLAGEYILPKGEKKFLRREVDLLAKKIEKENIFAEDQRFSLNLDEKYEFSRI